MAGRPHLIRALPRLRSPRLEAGEAASSLSTPFTRPRVGDALVVPMPMMRSGSGLPSRATSLVMHVCLSTAI